eukprot:Lankesteria_metandrocarpae@DN7486_c0_g1_i1.p1
MICASVQRMLLSLSALLDSVAAQQKAAEDLHKSVTVSELASSPDLQRTTYTHLEGWATITRHHDSTKGRLQTLRLEVKNHLTFIQQTQRDFELRDRKYRKMEEEMKRLQKQRFTSKPDPGALERQTLRTEKATADFRDSTTILADRAQHVLAGRQRYLQESTKNLFELQSEFFGKLSLAMNEANQSPQPSGVGGGVPARNPPSIQQRSYSGLQVSPPTQKSPLAPISGATATSRSTAVRGNHSSNNESLPAVNQRSNTMQHLTNTKPVHSPTSSSPHKAGSRSGLQYGPHPSLLGDAPPVGLVLEPATDCGATRQVANNAEDDTDALNIPPPPKSIIPQQTANGLQHNGNPFDPQQLPYKNYDSSSPGSSARSSVSASTIRMFTETTDLL